MTSSNIRSRTNATSSNQNGSPSPKSTEKPSSTSKSTEYEPDADEGPTHLSVLDILRVLGGIILLSSTLSYFITGNSITWNYRPAFTRPARVKAWLRGPLDLTDAQLALYNGTDPSLPILLAVNGTIYDVSASPHLYGPGGSYSFFTGRDATRAFVTGCFQEDLTGDLRGVEDMFIPADLVSESGGSDELSKEEKRERKLRREREVRLARQQVRDTVMGWEKMFDGGKEGKYFRVGKVDRSPESGWEGWGEKRELCKKAREGRPRRTAENVGR